MNNSEEIVFLEKRKKLVVEQSCEWYEIDYRLHSLQLESKYIYELDRDTVNFKIVYIDGSSSIYKTIKITADHKIVVKRNHYDANNIVVEVYALTQKNLNNIDEIVKNTDSRLARAYGNVGHRGTFFEIEKS